MTKSARNVLLHQYSWLLESLKSDGVIISNVREARICYRCFKKYERKTGGNLNGPDDSEAAKDFQIIVSASGDGPTVNDDLDKNVSAANSDTDRIDADRRLC